MNEGIADCQLPISEQETATGNLAIGNWKLAIGL
jgi:hypothetical protein